MCASSLGVETTRRFQPPPAKGIFDRMFANWMPAALLSRQPLKLCGALSHSSTYGGEGRVGPCASIWRRSNFVNRYGLMFSRLTTKDRALGSNLPYPRPDIRRIDAYAVADIKSWLPLTGRS